MLNTGKVDSVIGKAAVESLEGVELGTVYSEPTTDPYGHDALQVTIVVRSDKDGKLTGDRSLDAIVRIQQDLQRAGEERFAFVKFVMESELDQDADPQS